MGTFSSNHEDKLFFLNLYFHALIIQNTVVEWFGTPLPCERVRVRSPPEPSFDTGFLLSKASSPPS